MSLPAWTASKAIARLRRKLPDWALAHILEVARNKFGTDQLTKEQVNELVTALADGSIAKPTLSTASASAAAGQAAQREITMAPNRGALSDRTEHFLAGNHVGIRFQSDEDLTEWALTLLWPAKDSWTKTYHTWLKNQKVLQFTPQPGARLAPDLETLLIRRRRQVNRETMALPTRPSVRHAFWGFNEGDEVRANLRALVEAYRQNRTLKRGKFTVSRTYRNIRTLGHPDPTLKLRVVKVKPNLETPPTVTFEEV